jgi:hypothetical protein
MPEIMPKRFGKDGENGQKNAAVKSPLTVCLFVDGVDAVRDDHGIQIQVLPSIVIETAPNLDDSEFALGCRQNHNCVVYVQVSAPVKASRSAPGTSRSAPGIFSVATSVRGLIL